MSGRPAAAAAVAGLELGSHGGLAAAGTPLTRSAGCVPAAAAAPLFAEWPGIMLAAPWAAGAAAAAVHGRPGPPPRKLIGGGHA